MTVLLNIKGNHQALWCSVSISPCSGTVTVAVITALTDWPAGAAVPQVKGLFFKKEFSGFLSEIKKIAKFSARLKAFMCSLVMWMFPINDCVLKGLFWLSWMCIACLTGNEGSDQHAAPACSSDTAPGALALGSDDFKMVPLMDSLWYNLGFILCDYWRLFLPKLKPPMLCSHKFMKNGSENSAEKLKTLMLSSMRT